MTKREIKLTAFVHNGTISRTNKRKKTKMDLVNLRPASFDDALTASAEKKKNAQGQGNVEGARAIRRLFYDKGDTLPRERARTTTASGMTLRGFVRAPPKLSLPRGTPEKRGRDRALEDVAKRIKHVGSAMASGDVTVEQGMLELAELQELRKTVAEAFDSDEDGSQPATPKGRNEGSPGKQPPTTPKAGGESSPAKPKGKPAVSTSVVEEKPPGKEQRDGGFDDRTKEWGLTNGLRGVLDRQYNAQGRRGGGPKDEDNEAGIVVPQIDVHVSRFAHQRSGEAQQKAFHYGKNSVCRDAASAIFRWEVTTTDGSMPRGLRFGIYEPELTTFMDEPERTSNRLMKQRAARILELYPTQHENIRRELRGLDKSTRTGELPWSLLDGAEGRLFVDLTSMWLVISSESAMHPLGAYFLWLWNKPTNWVTAPTNAQVDSAETALKTSQDGADPYLRYTRSQESQTYVTNKLKEIEGGADHHDHGLAHNMGHAQRGTGGYNRGGRGGGGRGGGGRGAGGGGDNKSRHKTGENAGKCYNCNEVTNPPHESNTCKKTCTFPKCVAAEPEGVSHKAKNCTVRPSKK